VKKIFPLIIFLLAGCGSEETIVDCAQSDLALELIEVVDATCGEADGSISLIATGGTPPYRYKAGDFFTNETGVFTDLSQGIYDLSVSDANNCTSSARGVVVNPQGVVSFAQSIAPILTSNCTLPGCHVPEEGTSRQDLTNFTLVQQFAEEIKARTQRREMPKEGSLTQSQIDLIACWVDGGALDN